MSQEDVQKFVKEHVGHESVALLKNYLEWGLLSRTFILKEHDVRLQELRRREGHFSSYSEDQLRFIESRIYMEILERICLEIEDFCTICYALWGDLKRVPQSLLEQPTPQKILDEFDEARWHVLLRYTPLDHLDVSSSERALLERVRSQNTEVLQRFVEVLRFFLKLYWLPYTKHKHANTLIYGFQSGSLDDERAVLIPALYNSKDLSQVKGVIVTPSLYEHWKALHDTINQTTRDLIERTIEYIETGGETVTERITYFEVDAEERRELEALIQKTEEGRERVPINIKIEASVGEEILEQHRELLRKLSSLSS